MAASFPLMPPGISQTDAQTALSASKLGNFMSLLGKNHPRSVQEVDKAATDFESVFLTQMLEPLFNSPDIQWFGGGPSEDVFKSLMVQQFGTLIAKSGGVGIADMVKKELLGLQEVQKTPQQTEG
jgi:Rod binding domain-containing protein